MTIINYDEICNALKKDLKNDTQLYSMVLTFLKKIKKANDISIYTRQKWISRLKKVSVPIYEFRIPPGKRKEGVVRIYFGYKKKVKNTIVLLTFEFKRKTEANSNQIKKAESKYYTECN